MRDLLKRLVAEPIRSLCHWVDAVFEWFDSLNVEDCLGRLQSGVGFIVVLALIGASGFVLYLGPTWYVNESVGPQVLKTPFRAFELENETRKTFTQIVLGFWGAVALFFVWRRVKAGEKTAEVAEQGHITERYTKAIEQLGKLENGEPNIEVRLGAIYALERIAIDSPRDQQTIMEVLCAYVRQNSARHEPQLAATSGTSESSSSEQVEYLRVDIQAILTVVARRERGKKRERTLVPVDLSRSLMKCANLRKAHLEQANLYAANMVLAYLAEAYLDGANLKDADLRQAILIKARLRKARLNRSDLSRAALNHADLTLADLHQCRLVGAGLSDACLNSASLQDAQVQDVKLMRASLRGAILVDAQMQHAHLFGADMSGTVANRVKLDDADLRNATLAGAQLSWGYFNRANLEGAALERADLQEAEFYGARGLSVNQVKSAKNWEHAHYDPEFRRQLGLPDEQ